MKGLFYCFLVAKSHLEGKGNVENFLTAENCVKVELVTRLAVTAQTNWNVVICGAPAATELLN